MVSALIYVELLVVLAVMGVLGTLVGELAVDLACL